MPAELHKALLKEAKKRGYKGARKDAYVYGGMRNAGWKPKKEKSSGSGN